MTTTRDTVTNDIARETLGLETLETRNSDSLDFHEHAVWTIKEALQRAYEAGRRETAHAKMTFEGIELPTRAEAVQHANADPEMDTAITLYGKNYAVPKSTAEHLETEGIAFAYLHDHEMPHGTHRIMTVPVND